MVGEHPGEPESQPSPSHYLAEVGSKLLGSGNHMLQPPQYLRPQAWASRLSQNSLWKHTFGLVWSRRLPKAGHSCWGFSWWWPCSVTDQLDTGAQQMRSEGQIHLQYTGWRVRGEPWFPLALSYCPQPNRIYVAWSPMEKQDKWLLTTVQDLTVWILSVSRKRRAPPLREWKGMCPVSLPSQPPTKEALPSLGADCSASIPDVFSLSHRTRTLHTDLLYSSMVPKPLRRPTNPQSRQPC